MHARMYACTEHALVPFANRYRILAAETCLVPRSLEGEGVERSNRSRMNPSVKEESAQEDTLCPTLATWFYPKGIRVKTKPLSSGGLQQEDGGRSDSEGGQLPVPLRSMAQSVVAEC